MKRSKLAAAAIAAVAALTLAACGGGDAAEPAASGAAAAAAGPSSEPLILGSITDIASWAPSDAHVGHVLQPYQAPYDSLILRQPDGTLVPMLATEWSYNEDNTVLTLKLRDDVTFSDGAAFDAAAAKANLDYFKEKATRQAAQLANVASVEAPDATTLVITLSAPDPALEYYLSQASGLMASPAALGTEGIITNPVGSGPYVLDPAQTVAQQQYVFTAREGYWNPELQKFAGVTFKVLADPTAMVNAMATGEIDAGILNPATYEQAQGSGATVLEYTTDWAGLLLFDRDGTKIPALKELKVRQALNHAFDRATLLASFNAGKGEVTSQVFGPESGAYIPALDEAYPYDVAGAKALLAEAGYADGFELPLPVLPGGEALMTAITQQLSEIGVTVKATPVPVADFYPNIAKQDYPVAQFQLFQSLAWVNVNQMLFPKTLWNPFNSQTPELDALIADLQNAGTDNTAQAEAINQYVTDNAWFVPFYRPSQLYGYNAEKITVVPQTQMAIPAIYNYAPAA